MNWMDAIIERWHTTPDDGQQIYDALGMSPALYARWVEKPHKYVLGLDEVGYGSLAGPLVIGAVLAPVRWEHPLLKDSKAFKGDDDGKAERARANVLQQLAGQPDAHYFLHRTSSEDVDRFGVYKALMRAFSDVCEHVLRGRSDVLVVIDGDERVEGLEHICLPKADSFVPQVSAASIVAKVSRDTEMRLLDREYPGYLFGKHKGYGTKEHRAAILNLGLCPIHRRSYKMKFLENSSSSSRPSEPRTPSPDSSSTRAS